MNTILYFILNNLINYYGYKKNEIIKNNEKVNDAKEKWSVLIYKIVSVKLKIIKFAASPLILGWNHPLCRMMKC